MQKLMTIGYEGADLEDFLATLASQGVSTLVDVRELPLSRRRGFSKRALAAILAQRRIEYVHMRSLGDPKPGRLAARSGNYSLFRKIYSNHLKTDEAKVAIGRLGAMMQDEIICLMCFERDYRQCHRSMVATELQKSTRSDLTHLYVSRSGGDLKNGTRKPARGSRHSREGNSPPIETTW
jgi:uncharacterized protein (DUF488 family)